MRHLRIGYDPQMGLHDRDYYRDDYARKNGMRYNARNATYSRSPAQRRVQAKSANEFGFVGKLLISLAVLLICAVTWRYFK